MTGASRGCSPRANYSEFQLCLGSFTRKTSNLRLGELSRLRVRLQHFGASFQDRDDIGGSCELSTKKIGCRICDRRELLPGSSACQEPSPSTPNTRTPRVIILLGQKQAYPTTSSLNQAGLTLLHRYEPETLQECEALLTHLVQYTPRKSESYYRGLASG